MAYKPNTKHYGKVKATRGKDPAAVSLGRKGGKVGGRARARALSGAKRSEIAVHAAKKRWGAQSSYSLPAYYKRTPVRH